MLTIRRAEERGHANHGWLDSHHTFSFAGYHDPEHMGFRSLRVINDDIVEGAGGFPTHPHQDFEIITYIIDGALEHRDSMGHSAVMRAGEVQRISAGTGIRHSEFNHSPSDPVHLLQIWIEPSRRGVTPDYAQQSFRNGNDGLTLVCSGNGRDGSIRINQDADLYVGRMKAGEELRHSLADRRYAWIQLIDGDLAVGATTLAPGDGAAIGDESGIDVATKSGAHFLLFDLS